MGQRGRLLRRPTGPIHLVPVNNYVITRRTREVSSHGMALGQNNGKVTLKYVRASVCHDAATLQTDAQG